MFCPLKIPTIINLTERPIDPRKKPVYRIIQWEVNDKNFNFYTCRDVVWNCICLYCQQREILFGNVREGRKGGIMFISSDIDTRLKRETILHPILTCMLETLAIITTITLPLSSVWLCGQTVQVAWVLHCTSGAVQANTQTYKHE